MDIKQLIDKEKRDYKKEISQIYEKIKSMSAKLDEDTKKHMLKEAEMLEELRQTLINLRQAYDKNNGEETLEQLTKKANEDYESFCEKYKIQIPDDKIYEYYKKREKKACLDRINGVTLTKEEIYNYLNDYNQIMQIARNNLFTPINTIFYQYMSETNQPEKANFRYYQNMIKIHILFTHMNIMSAIKDEDFEFMNATDEEMAEKNTTGKLEFLKDRFIVPEDSSRFKKTNVFNFIRNAFFHSDNKELYKIYPDCNFLKISLSATDPVPFNIKLSANDLYEIASSISDYSHHATTYVIENQEKIDVDKLVLSYAQCSKELDKISLIKKIFASKTGVQKETIHEDLIKNGGLKDTTVTDNILQKYGLVTEKQYKLSELQKKLLHKKFVYFNKYLSNIGLDKFVVPIVLHYMNGGICKINQLLFDSALSYTYLFNPENSIYSIMQDVLDDYTKLQVDANYNFNKKTIFNFLNKDVDISKKIFIFLFDEEENNNLDDFLLLNYIFGVYTAEEIQIGNKIVSVEKIRNAFTHGRRIIYEDNGKKYYYLYDDEDTLADPNNAYWCDTFEYSDLKTASETIVSTFTQTQNLKKLTKK